MSSDLIKGLLVSAYPGTLASEWKRRSKTKVEGGEQRTFENTVHNITAITLEKEDGTVSLDKRDTIVGTLQNPIDERVPAAAKKFIPTIGDTVMVPKGTLVLEGYGHEFYYADQLKRTTSKQNVKVKLSNIVNASDRWYLFISKDNRERIKRECNIGYWRDLFVDRWADRPKAHTSEQAKLIAEIKLETDAVFENYVFVSWANDQKHCLVSKVQPAEANKTAEPKEAKIDKRRQMVPDSEWIFTKDCLLEMWMDNPKIRELCDKRDAIRTDPNSQHSHGGTITIVLGGGRKNTPAEEEQMAAIQKEIDDTPRQVKVKVCTIFKGAKFKIVGKQQAAYSSYGNKETNGLTFPCQMIENDAEYYLDMSNARWLSGNPLFEHHTSDWAARIIGLPYKMIEAFVEPTLVPETIVYVLRDSVTKEYFGGWQSERTNYGSNRQTDEPKMSTTFSGSKKYKNLAAVKASIMDFTGYHNGMELETYSGEWVGQGDKKIDLPPNWEAVAIDKTTNTDKEIHDVQDWYKNLMRLRDITKNVGPAVRGLFKKIEEKAEEYPCIVYFDFNGNDNVDTYDGLSDNEKKKVKDAMVNIDSKAPSNKTPLGHAYALKNDGDATLVYLAYQGIAKVKVYKTTTLEEMVLPEKASV